MMLLQRQSPGVQYASMTPKRPPFGLQLKNGRLPELTAVRDVTDHAVTENAYYKPE